MPYNNRWVTLVSTIVLISTIVGHARAAYIFKKIVDNTGLLSTFELPAINNSGTVAFHALFDDGGSGVFTGNGGPTTTIADSSGPFDVSLFESPSINDAGTVAFRALFDDGGSGVFTGNGGPTTTIADSSGPFDSFGDPSINENGIVAFVADYDIGSINDNGIFIGSGGPTTTIADFSGPLQLFRSESTINDSGIVAFRASRDFGGGNGIFVGSGGPTTTISDSNGPFISHAFPSINNSGTVAFQADFDAGGDGIFTGSGGSISTVADSTGPFETFDFPSLNENGVVAFSARLDAGDYGIFTGDDPVADRVIGNGDPLFGSTVDFVNFGLFGLNDNGDIAFTYVLANGTHGIAVASVVPEVPEPASIVLAAVGLAALLAWSGKSRATS